MSTISRPGRRAGPLLLLALLGCSESGGPPDTRPRKAVTGSVTLDGQPLAEGSIQFDPVERTAQSAVAFGGIKDGKYTIDRALGPVPGKYKVSISSRAAPKHTPGEPLPKPEPEKVPAQFNARSTIEKDVTDDAENKIDFDLKG